MAGELLLDRPADGVLRLTISNPAKRNALDHAILDAIAVVLGDLGDTRAVVLTGADGMFSSGYDIGDIPDDVFAEEAERLVAHPFSRAIEAVEAFPFPTLAAINGHALGGGLELALACDLRVASERAKLGLPEVRLAVTPGAGGTQRLPRFIGQAKAMDLCLTGRMMDAAEAERAGLVSRIVPADKLLEEAIAVAEKIAQLSRPIAMMVKESVNRAFETTLAEGVRFERRLFHSTFATEDQKEGMAAFIAKRKPAFRNR